MASLDKGVPPGEERPRSDEGYTSLVRDMVGSIDTSKSEY